MKRNLFFGLLILFCCTLSAQEGKNDKDAKSIVVDIDTNIVFDKTIDYLWENGYFLMSLDKEVGFIQAKIIVKKGANIFTGKSDERLTLNFLIKPIDNNESRIMLDINREQKWTIEHGNDSYADKGKLDRLSVYEKVLNDLKNSFDN